MDATCQGVSTDQFGGEAIIIRNDGRVLRTTIHGMHPAADTTLVIHVQRRGAAGEAGR